MSRHDVVIIGAGAAGLSAGALLANEGKSVLIVEASPWLGGRGVGGARRGLQDQSRRPPGRGLGLGHHQGLRARGQGAGARCHVSSDMVIWDHEKSRWGLDPRAVLGRQVRAQEADPDRRRDALRGLRRVGRPDAARVDAPAHHARGRDRAVGVHHRARGDHRELVGPLGLGQPLHAQDALLREGHRPATRSGPARAGTGCSTTCATRSSRTAARCG